MEPAGIITVKGVVQGVGFRPFVYARAVELGIHGSVKNLGSEVEIRAAGPRFSEFVRVVSAGPPMARIDSVVVRPLADRLPNGFVIEKSAGEVAFGHDPSRYRDLQRMYRRYRHPG